MLRHQVVEWEPWAESRVPFNPVLSRVLVVVARIKRGTTYQRVYIAVIYCASPEYDTCHNSSESGIEMPRSKAMSLSSTYLGDLPP